VHIFKEDRRPTMQSWSRVIALGALALLVGCAEQSAFTQADRERRAAVTRCSAEASARRPIWNSKQLLSRPGEPRPLSVEYQSDINRRTAECLNAMPAETPLRGRALDVS
jgi:hypothetical protein